jgi:membrane-associated protease RseP (regulator of RpoE activity)
VPWGSRGRAVCQSVAVRGAVEARAARDTLAVPPLLKRPMPLHRAALVRLPLAALLSALLSALLAGCPALYPELGTRTRPAVAGQPLDPPPPETIRWVRVVSARVPEKNRGGRSWQANGNAADAYAKVYVNEREIFRTAVAPNTLEPTWPKGPMGNFKFGRGDKLGVELWDANPLNDKPICIQQIGSIDDEALHDKIVRVLCEGGGEVIIAFEPAHAVQGAGLWYELRLDSTFITRLLQGSPAERAGLLPGDEILSIGGRPVKDMSSDEVQSRFTAIPVAGLALKIKHPDGTSLDVTLKEGPIYPLYDQFGAVD